MCYMMRPLCGLAFIALETPCGLAFIALETHSWGNPYGIRDPLSINLMALETHSWYGPRGIGDPFIGWPLWHQRPLLWVNLLWH